MVQPSIHEAEGICGTDDGVAVYPANVLVGDGYIVLPGEAFTPSVAKMVIPVAKQDLHARNNAPILFPNTALAPRIVTPRNAIAHTPKALATDRPVPRRLNNS